MKISVQRFTFLLVFILVGIFAAVTLYTYNAQKEKTAAVVLKSINSEISQINYIISKSLTKKDDVLLHRALLERIAVNNDFIKAILIHDGYNVLLTTDPFSHTILATHKIDKDEDGLYNSLMKREAVENTIRFYVGNKIETLELMFLLDKKEIEILFKQKNLDFLFLSIFLPLLIMFTIWVVTRKFIVNPLELLRQFAYYQNKVPQAFTIQELETIRYSMVETFNRLENEKKELYAVARTDALSGLANRNALTEYLTRLISVSKRDGAEFAVLFLDLDHFKSVNDSLGHNVGDELLKQIASIIDEVLRSDDFVARVGGDEFIIVLRKYKSIHELTVIIDRIQKRLSQTFIIQTNPIHISSSIGIAFYPKDGDNIVSLMKNSDIAMYEAKANGRSQYYFFTQEINKRVQDVITLEKEMKTALLNNEYELYYQPKIDFKTGKIVAAEALIRWLSPTKGMVSPADFIPIAEENGFIVELGEWILETAIKQQVVFKSLGMDIKISINLSAQQLQEDSFIEFFTKIMQENRADRNLIDIEITEYMFYKNNKTNQKLLNDLHSCGVTISLDDFGTGYSSLSYLKDFPIDYLKIDKSFIDDYADERGRIFIDTIVKMGQTLKMKIIAEGVETKEQFDYLKSINCDQYQGYYMSKPLCVKDFESLYRRESKKIKE